MGSDISGWVEILHRPGDGYYQLWDGVIKIDGPVERNYGMFGNLFGHRNVGAFSPVAAGRGTPSGPSDEVRDDMAYAGVVHPSWLLWSEILEIDWEQEGEEEVFDSQSLGRKVQRKDTIAQGWSALFDLMEVLADQFGDANVRLVVWFDSE